MSIRRDPEQGIQQGYGASRAPLAPQAGRAPLLLALVLLAAAVAVIAAMTGSKPDPEPQVESPGDMNIASEAGPEDLEGHGTGRIDVGIDLPYKELSRTYDGVGHLTGILEVIGDAEFPDQWQLVLRPSSMGQGREHAEGRTLDFDGSVRTFEITDLPLGGYEVFAQAGTLNSRPQEVLLFSSPQSPTGGKTRVHLILHLTPPGVLDGYVHDADGVGVPDLPVFLEDLSRELIIETRTDATGVWRLDEMLDGRYRLSYGTIERPLLPAQLFLYAAPVRSLEPHELPVTSSVEIAVLDKWGNPVPGIELTGSGRPGGAFYAVADEHGMAIVSFLKEGRYGLKGIGNGMDGSVDFELERAAFRKRVEIVMNERD